MQRALTVCAMVLTACSAGAPADKDPAPSTEPVAATTSNTPAETETITNLATSTPELQAKVTMIEPVNEDGYLDGLRRREPERMLAFSREELVELGRVACNATAEYISGTEPTPGDELREVMIGRGHDPDLSDAMTSDIRNASQGTLCDVERVEVG